MRRTVKPFWAASAVSFALAGGQAAAHWQRALARSTAGLDALRRACAWIETLNTTHPRLRDGPLLGHCLEALTGPVNRPAEPEPAETLPRRFRSTCSERARETATRGDSWAAPPWLGSYERSARAEQGSQSTGESRPGETPSRRSPSARPEREIAAPLPFQLESQASQALLSRLTGASVSAGGAGRPRNRIPQEPSARTQDLPSVPREPGARQNWLHELLRRAERSLHQNGFDAPPTSRLAPSGRPEYDRAPSLADQWAMSLNGQSVSTALLAHLTHAPVVSSEGSRRNLTSETAPQRPSGSRPSGTPALAAQSAPPWHTEGGPASTDPLAPLAGPLEAHDGGSGHAPYPPGARSPGSPAPTVTRGAQPWQTAERSASADLSAPLAGAPAGDGDGFERQALPPAIRQGARQEQADAVQDDLNALAAQIKHILDEQARRHGIDV